MKNRLNYPFTGTARFAQYCRISYHGALAQLQRIKESIQAEFAKRFLVDERMLRVALIEAEAEAWETGYPQLVFPGLAEEKAQAVIKWQARQSAILQHAPELAFAE